MRAQRSGAVALLAILSGCWTLGPKYQRPSVATPNAYKELTPEQRRATAGWKTSQPQDNVIHGRWWRVFNDPSLGALEDQVDVSNQNVAASFAAYVTAQALIRAAKAQYFPTVSAGPGVLLQRAPSEPLAEFSLVATASWAPDLWGRVRSQVNQNVAQAQASAADLENERLLEQADLAIAYYQLRGQDSLQTILDATVVADRSLVELTRSLYETGIDSEESLAQADALLQTTEAQAISIGIARAQDEHAVAVLLGQSPSTFSIAVDDTAIALPAIPYGVPSELLERRPDIASAERSVAAANAQIGIGVAAFYPNLTLSASGGVGSSSLATLFSLPSLVWSLGVQLTQLIYDGGLRQATLDEYKALYAQTVANYRQTVLTAFQQVEDSLSTLRILSRELEQQELAIVASQRFLTLATTRYKLGIDPYLNVLTAQVTLLGNQQTAVGLRTLQQTTSVQLIAALGGGWDDSRIPTLKELAEPPTAPLAPP